MSSSQSPGNSSDYNSKRDREREGYSYRNRGGESSDPLSRNERDSRGYEKRSRSRSPQRGSSYTSSNREHRSYHRSDDKYRGRGSDSRNSDGGTSNIRPSNSAEGRSSSHPSSAIPLEGSGKNASQRRIIEEAMRLRKALQKQEEEEKLKEREMKLSTITSSSDSLNTSSDAVNNSVLVPISRTTSTESTDSAPLVERQKPEGSWKTRNIYLEGSRSVGCYRPIHAIDEGTYGRVWLAEDKETGEHVAMKQIKFEKIDINEGFPITALRESNILLSLSHPNIIRVREVVVGSSLNKVYMVMDLAADTLTHFIDRLPGGTFLTQSEMKCLMRQLLSGVAHMHSYWVVHRDLKTANLLLDDSGVLKIADFGLARKCGSVSHRSGGSVSSAGHLTPNVVTLWYRAPEILLGGRYGSPSDLWSVGCIFAELLTREVLFPAQNEVEAVNRIFRCLGTPNNSSTSANLTNAGNVWPGWFGLPNVQNMHANVHAYEGVGLRKTLKLASFGFAGAPFLSDSGLDLLGRLLTIDPARRISAAEALEHPWFKEEPLPAHHSFLRSLR